MYNVTAQLISTRSVEYIVIKENVCETEVFTYIAVKKISNNVLIQGHSSGKNVQNHLGTNEFRVILLVK